MAKVITIKKSDIENAFEDIKNQVEVKGVHTYTNTIYRDEAISINIEAKANITNEEVVDEEKTAEEQAKLNERKAKYEEREAAETAEAEAAGMTLEEFRKKKQEDAIEADYAARAEAQGITVEELKQKEKEEQEEEERKQKEAHEDYVANYLVEHDMTQEEYDAMIAERKAEREAKSAEWNRKWRAEECEKYNCSDEDLDRVMEEYNKAHMWDANPVMKNVLSSKDSLLPYITITSEDVMFGGVITTELGNLNDIKGEITTKEEALEAVRTYFASTEFGVSVANFNQENDTDLEIRFVEE